MAIQDYIKFRPIESNKTIDDIQNKWILRTAYDHRNRFEEKQFSFISLLWGRKINLNLLNNLKTEKYFIFMQ